LIAEAQSEWVIMSDDDQLLMHRLRAHVTSLAEEIGERNVFNSEALRRAAAYIEAEWRALDYGVERLEYDVSGIRCANLIATREGNIRRNEILLLGAHYDSVVGCPGANDNASGVAALLETSRMFRAINTALTVRFVAFVNEEPPFFGTGQQGSLVYAQAARRRGDDIRLMASLETIGCYSSEPGSQRYPPLFRFFYPNRGNFIGIVSDFGSRAAVWRLAGVSRSLRLPFADCFDVPVRSRGVMERPRFILAARLSRRDGHRHRILPLPALPRCHRYAGQACLSGVRRRYAWPVQGVRGSRA
jgi:hypothetical protein